MVGTDRQLVTALSRHVDVLWVEPPRSVVTPRPGEGLRPRLTDVGDGVRRLTVTVPPMPHRRGMQPLTEAQVRLVVCRVLKSDGRRPSAVVSTMPFASLDYPESPSRVYYATDGYAAGADLLGRDPEWLRALESRRLAEATDQGAVSEQITSGWPPSTRSFVLPNGVNTTHFADVEDAPRLADVTVTGPVAGVVGHLSARIDLDLLEAVAQTPLTLLMVGPRVESWGGRRFDDLVARDNVQWVGNKPYAELPSYLRLIDVGLTPYVDSAFNRASSPLKTLEYLAAGRAALSTPLPGVQSLGTDLISCAASPAEFATAAVSAAAVPRTADLVRARQEFARAHDWTTRAVELLGILGLQEQTAVTRVGR